jgi:hypothetical protein
MFHYLLPEIISTFAPCSVVYYKCWQLRRVYDGRCLGCSNVIRCYNVGNDINMSYHNLCEWLSVLRRT